MKTSDVSQFWNVLGSFWSQFENKDYIQELWQNYYNTISGLNQKSLDLRKSLGFTQMSAVVLDQHNSYDVIYDYVTDTYSGLVNSYLVSGSDGFKYEYSVLPGTISIPTLTYYHLSDSGTLSALQTLTEGTDYEIRDMDRIRFTGSPPFIANAAQTHFSGNSLFAETSYRLNPALWGIEALRAGLSESSLINQDYTAYVSGYASSGVARAIVDADHFKYLVWALQDGLRRKPTVGNIEHLYGVARGLPFAHNSGILASGLIGGIAKTYPVSGYYTAWFSPPSSGIGSISTNYPLFGADDYTWDFVAKISSGFVLYNVVDGIGYGTQTLAIGVQNGYAKFIMNDISASGLVDVNAWHKYTVKRLNDTNVEFYIDDTLLSSGALSTTWQTFTDPAYYAFGVYTQWNMDTHATEGVIDNTKKALGYLAQVKIRNASGVTNFHAQFVPTTSLTQKIVLDLSASGYTNTLGSGIWTAVDIPLVGYTTKDLGDTVDLFEVLLPGVHVYDHVNNSGIIANVTDFAEERFKHITINDEDLLYRGTLRYDANYVVDTMDTYIPAHLTYGINDAVYSGIFIAPWGVDTSDGSRHHPVRTFNAASALVDGPKTIWYRGGTYNEFVRTALLSGVGTSWSSPVSVKAFPGETVRLINTDSTSSGIIAFDKAGAGYVSFEGLTLDGLDKPALLVDMAVSGSQYGRIYECTLRNVVSGGANAMVKIAEQGHCVENSVIDPGTWADITGIQLTRGDYGTIPLSGLVSYNDVSNLGRGIEIIASGTSMNVQVNIHHNYIHDNSIGTSLAGHTLSYFHNNLVENCGWGLAVGYGRKVVLPQIFNNTIQGCRASGTYWKESMGFAAGIRMGSLETVHGSTSDFCQAGYFVNNLLKDCDISYYDPSGVVDSINFANVHATNVSDDNTLPSSGYTSASTNLNSGLIFFHEFRTATTSKNYKLHPYFSSGYAYGGDVSGYPLMSAISGLSTDFAGISRTTYSGWDAGAFENLA